MNDFRHGPRVAHAPAQCELSSETEWITKIRRETQADEAAIATLVTTAFAAVPQASGTEAAIVQRLRAARALLVSLVASGPDGLIGYLAASPLTVDGETGWVGLGPLAVRPTDQRSGVGSALMYATLGLLRKSGSRGAVLVGDPGYYRRFGFVSHAGLTIPGVPAEVVLALPFGSRCPRGIAVFHSAFGIE